MTRDMHNFHVLFTIFILCKNETTQDWELFRIWSLQLLVSNKIGHGMELGVEH